MTMDIKPDYRKYRPHIKEVVPAGIVYEAVLALVGFLFYNSLLPCLLFAPGFWLFMKALDKRWCDRRQRRLNAEFKELLVALSANMAAGYSLESAFAPAYEELKGIYQGRSLIEKETLYIVRGLQMSADVDVLLADFAERSGLADIREFAGVVKVAKGAGGNLIQMMRRMIHGIDGRIEVEDEIDTMITSKRLEQKIMSAMPFVIILYLRTCNRGYMDVLYGSVFGVVFMTVCLVVIAATVLWGRRITDIRV